MNAVAFGTGITPSAVTTGLYTFVASSATARYLFTDGTTQGNWPGTYGKDGYVVYNGTTALPTYATYGPIQDGDFYRDVTFVTDNIATDPRAPFSSAAAINRVATGISRNIADMNFDINVGPGKRSQRVVGVRPCLLFVQGDAAENTR